MPFINSLSAEPRHFDWTDLGNLDNVVSWPAAVRTGLLLVLFAVCLVLGFFLYLTNLRTELLGAARIERRLSAEFEHKAFQAASLKAYRAQVEEMESTFSRLLRQLPSATEVPGLVDDVTAAGESSGLNFDSMALQPELAREFYTELPIDVVVTGSFHDFGRFVSRVASLDRIVTLHDFKITTGKESLLAMTILARTYRYREFDE